MPWPEIRLCWGDGLLCHIVAKVQASNGWRAGCETAAWLSYASRGWNMDYLVKAREKLTWQCYYEMCIKVNVQNWSTTKSTKLLVCPSTTLINSDQPGHLCPVCSATESLLCALLVAKDLNLQASSDQTGGMPRLSEVFAGSSGNFVGFVVLQLIWAASWQNQHVCPAKTQISLGIHPAWPVFAVGRKEAWVLSYPLSAQQRLWSDWANAQADRSLCWAHSHFVGFVMRQLMYTECLDITRQEDSEWASDLSNCPTSDLCKLHGKPFIEPVMWLFVRSFLILYKAQTCLEPSVFT